MTDGWVVWTIGIGSLACGSISLALLFLRAQTWRKVAERLAKEPRDTSHAEWVAEILQHVYGPRCPGLGFLGNWGRIVMFQSHRHPIVFTFNDSDPYNERNRVTEEVEAILSLRCPKETP